MAFEAAVSGNSPLQTGLGGRRIANLLGALALHIPLALWALYLCVYTIYSQGLPDTQAVLYLAGGAVIWLALAALLIKWWVKGRPQLWEAPLAWLLLASLGLFLLPLVFWPRCRRWLARSCMPWRGTPETETESRATAVWHTAALLLLPDIIVYGPLIAMSASGLIGEHTYSWRDVSFSYPAEFRNEGTPAQSNQPAAQIEAVSFSYMGDRDSGVFFQVLEWDVPGEIAGGGDIPDATIEATAEELEGMTGFDAFIHGHISGLPALAASDPKRARSFSETEVWKSETWVLDTDAGLVYVLSCQYEDDHRTAVEEACQQVLSSFKVERND